MTGNNLEIRKIPATIDFSSVLAVVSKLFQKRGYGQLNTYLIKDYVFSHCQYEFGKGHSTVTLLLKTTDNWLMNIDRGLINSVMFLDLNESLLYR